MKKLFVEKMYEKGYLTKKDAKVIYDAMCEVIDEILTEQGEFVIKNVGTLRIVKSVLKSVYNFKTKERVAFDKEVKRLTFRASKVFKNKLVQQ